MAPIDRLVDVRINEFAHGMTRLAMRRAKASFLLSTMFGGLLFAALLVLATVRVSLGNPDGVGLGDVGYLAFVSVWVAVAIPWSRMRLLAAFLKLFRSGALAPYRIVGFEPGSMSLRSEFGDSNLAFGRFDLRFETKTVFVLGRTDQSLGSVIPKRIFGGEAELAEFRASFFAVSTATNDALHAMAEPIAGDAIRYVLTPAEYRRGMRHLVRRTTVGRFVLVILVLALGAFAFMFARIVADSPEVATFTIVFVGAAFFVGLRRGNARLRNLLTETTFTFDDHGVRFGSSGGSLESAWSDVRGVVEDEIVFILRMPRDVGIILPKRALDEETLGELRGRAAPPA